MKVHENYINGAWAKAPERAPNINPSNVSVNPSNVSDVVGEFARADYVNP
jgi:hypothetical protein